MEMRKVFLWVLLVMSLFVLNLSYAEGENILFLHFHYAKNTFAPSSSTELTLQKSEFSLWELLVQADAFLRRDIALELQSAQRATLLSNYIQEGETLSSSLSHELNRIQLDLDTKENTFNLCSNQLRTANDAFSQSISSNNELGYHNALLQAKKARTCLWETQVDLSAFSTLKQKLMLAKNALDPRVAYLKKNQTLILEHYDVLDSQLLSELYKVSTVLENNFEYQL